MYKNIIFDFDGVLVESVEVKTNAFRSMYLKYGVDFAERVVSHHRNNGGVSRFEKFQLYHGEWLNKLVNQQLIDELSSEFSELVIEEVIKAPEVKGAMDFLNDYYNKCRFWLVTGTPTNEILIILQKRNMTKYFKEVYGSPIGKIEWVEKIINDHQLNRDETVFVGDAKSDYNAAITNKIHFILRKTPENVLLFNDYNGLQINDINDLKKILEK